MTKYLLVDYENVQPKDLEDLRDRAFKIIVFVGANQGRVSVQLASSLQPFGDDAKYIQISGNGKNALDFHIAFAIGELSKENPGSSFNIISGDTGFDPLIDYLRSKKIRTHRWKRLTDIPSLKVRKAGTEPDRVDAIIRNLASKNGGRPKTVKKLSNTIKDLFRNSPGQTDPDALINALVKSGYVKIDGDNVSY